MRKKALSLALALIMALSLLPVAASASTTEPYLYDVKFIVSNGVAPSQATASYQVREVQKNSTGAYVYGSVVTTNPTTAYVLPLDTGITIDKLRRGSGALTTDLVLFYAWSDPDNDGVYEQRVFSTRSAESEYRLVPLTEKGPFVSTDDVTYTDFQTPVFLGFKPQLGSSTYSITLGADQLCDLFGPNTLLVIQVVETTDFLSRMSCTVLLTGEASALAPVSSFADVPAGAYYADPVAWAVEKNITNGTGVDTFSPSQNCTQGQILTFLYRAERGEGAASADDMNKAIAWAREKGMIDDSFSSSTPCTRATAVSYIWQAFDKPSATLSSFTDVDAKADYAAAVSWAVEKNVTNGTDADTFSPDKICNRGEIVTFLYRAYNN